MGQTQHKGQGQFTPPRTYQFQQSAPDRENSDTRRWGGGRPTRGYGLVMVSLALMGRLGHERLGIVDRRVGGLIVA